MCNSISNLYNLSVITAQALTNSQRFLNAYNQLDTYLRSARQDHERLTYSALVETTQSIPPKWKSKLKAYGSLRNAIVHSERGMDEVIAEPHLEEVERYEKFVQQILHPPTALSKAVPIQQVFSVSRNDNVFKVIATMNAKVYSHAPLLEDGCVVGVFSENTIFSYLGHHGEALLDSSLTIGAFGDFLQLESHASECFQFVPRQAPLADVAQIFKEEKRYRVGAVFITENGKSFQRLLGMLTFWDLTGEFL